MYTPGSTYVYILVGIYTCRYFVGLHIEKLIQIWEFRDVASVGLWVDF